MGGRHPSGWRPQPFDPYEDIARAPLLHELERGPCRCPVRGRPGGRASQRTRATERAVPQSALIPCNLVSGPARGCGSPWLRTGCAVPVRSSRAGSVETARFLRAPFPQRWGRPDLQHLVQRGSDQMVTPRRDTSSVARSGARWAIPPLCAPGTYETVLPRRDPASLRSTFPSAELPSRADLVRDLRPVFGWRWVRPRFPPCSLGSSPCSGGPTLEPYGSDDSHVVGKSP